MLGFDNAPAMLDVGRKNLHSLAIANVELAEADVHALPLPDDAAVANMVLHHVHDPGAMIAEIARVTRPRRLGRHHRRGRTPLRMDRAEHADVWLGFSEHQIEGFFGDARLSHYGYAPLGTQ